MVAKLTGGVWVSLYMTCLQAEYAFTTTSPNSPTLTFDIYTSLQAPFKSRNSGELRKKIKTAKLRLPRYLSKHAASLIKGVMIPTSSSSCLSKEMISFLIWYIYFCQLLNKDPAKRLGSKNGSKELKAHPFFSGLSWRKLMKREVTPPFRPQLVHSQHPHLATTTNYHTLTLSNSNRPREWRMYLISIRSIRVCGLLTVLSIRTTPSLSARKTCFWASPMYV